MVISMQGVARVTVSLAPEDVDLIDRLSRLEGSNRSAVLRSLLASVRPGLLQTVEAFERAAAAREQLDKAAAAATITELEEIRAEVDAMQLRALGAIAKLEGLAAADPRRGNHGGHTPTPSPEEDPS